MVRLNVTKRRKQIVKVAISLFSKNGFRGTKTRDIALKAGISEALLFKHFPHKENLYEAILQCKMEEKLPLILEGLNEKNPKKLLYDLALKIVKSHEEDSSFLRLLHYSVLEGHELSDLFFQKRNLPIREFLKSYLMQQMHRGVIKKIDPEKTVFAFMSFVFGYVNMRVLFRIPQIVKKNPKEYMKHYMHIFWEGIKK